MTGTSGAFTSPNYPNYYSPNTTCQWDIEVRHIHISSSSECQFCIGQISVTPYLFKGSSWEIHQAEILKVLGVYGGTGFLPRRLFTGGW